MGLSISLHQRDLAIHGQALPTILGSYVLFDRIGRGGMAEIFLARTQTIEARAVVIKKILPEFAIHKNFIKALIDEAKLASRLCHTNIVQVYDLGHALENDEFFIVMEYIEGYSLSDIVRECIHLKLTLPIEFIVWILCEVLQGLEYAHRFPNETGQPLGAIHRDISPSNILISREGEVKICDFGIAYAKNHVTTSDEQSIQGKAAYMSPEQAWGQPLTDRADVFAVGSILWELLAGRSLYCKPQGNDERLLDVARRASIVAPPARGFPYEKRLHTIVLRALEHDCHKRYSAKEMREALQEYQICSRRMASALRFSTWLNDCFGTSLFEIRRARERAICALQRGPAASINVRLETTQKIEQRRLKPIFFQSLRGSIREFFKPF